NSHTYIILLVIRSILITLCNISCCNLYIIFFFKQKTAYEIGLGIPAEPLFRSYSNNPKHLFQGYLNIYNNYFKAPWMPDRTEANPKRSEERRVGKECRSRWWS